MKFEGEKLFIEGEKLFIELEKDTYPFLVTALELHKFLDFSCLYDIEEKR